MTDADARNADLRQMLVSRRNDLRKDVRARIRDGRTDREKVGGDSLDQSDADTQGDLGLTLLQMQAGTLARIDEALARLDAGKYGSCAECEGEISDRRLRAMPFAVRCQACEEQREKDQARPGQSRTGISVFGDAVGF